MDLGAKEMGEFERKREFWMREFGRKRLVCEEMREMHRVFVERKDGSWRVRENVKRRGR